jgi:hypothetical protein
MKRPRQSSRGRTRVELTRARQVRLRYKACACDLGLLVTEPVLPRPVLNRDSPDGSSKLKSWTVSKYLASEVPQILDKRIMNGRSCEIRLIAHAWSSHVTPCALMEHVGVGSTR